MNELYVKQICPKQDNQFPISSLSALLSKKYSLEPYGELTIKFLDTFSRRLMTNKSINTFPEIVALGFWLRKSNIQKLIIENNFLNQLSVCKISPLGKVLHICPANVDTMFVYSMSISLLVGNKNILRISNRMQATHIQEIFFVLNDLISEKEFSIFSEYINIISYEHSDEVSSYLSVCVNARVIWGGDQTIHFFKKFLTKPRTKDLVFSDRVSMLCIKSESYLKLRKDDVRGVLQLFFSDAYTFDQMGCSSPQTIYFIGNDSNSLNCLKRFQLDMIEFLPSKYQTDLNSLGSLKLNRMISDLLENTIVNQQGNNYIKFLELDDNVDESLLHGCGGGYFYYRFLNSIDQIKSVENVKVQTLSHWGFADEELLDLNKLSNCEGLDRIVPMGEALNFHYIWDGYNLFEELSRKVFFKA
jgi:hypothetical protein